LELDGLKRRGGNRNRLIASARTLSDLGFSEVTRALAARCRTEIGRTRAASLDFLQTAEEVGASLRRIEEARGIADSSPLPLDWIPDVRPAVRRAGKGAALQPAELIQISHILFSFARIRESLETLRSGTPLLSEIAQRMPLLETLASRLDRSFEPSGEISDRASPELKEARERCRALHRAIKARIEATLRDEKFLPVLRENYFTIRNSRYVFPVLAQRRSEVPGIVHNASQTGQTLFIEPDFLIAHGNELAIAESVMQEEERRVLQELSAAVGRVEEAIVNGVEAAAELDLAAGAASLARDLDASSPTISEKSDSIDLVQLRHPLLVLRGKQVVPNDFSVAPPVKAVIISGPNAGGKTATLTAVGLSALMLRAGLPIAARANSKVPLYAAVYSIVGDPQDLSHDLSTFSGHVEQLRQIAAAVDADSLVLIDEIVADTNPREGAAIAIAVLEDLTAKKATVLATTHLEELKTLPHLDQQFLNASVGFDAARLAPTYRLQLGVAGTSSAIEIAVRAGLPPSICARARELVRGSAGPFSNALTALEEERARLEAEVERARGAAAAAEQARIELEAERLAVARRAAEQELSQREQLERDLRQAGEELRSLLTKIRADSTPQAVRQAQRQIEQRVREETGRIGEIKKFLSPAEVASGVPDIREHGWVHHQGLDADVEILELTEDQALISAGALKMRVPLTELSAARRGRPKPEFASGAVGERAVQKAEQIAPALAEAEQATCDIRGLRLEDAIREVEKFLDSAFRSGQGQAVIVHGHGTGALKRAVRELLADSRYVRLYRPGDSHEGGDGVTVVALRS
jgi:DNA mismatch repair protein MutS2